MIYPKKNSFIKWFFDGYIDHIVKMNFFSIDFNQIDIDTSRSILLLANHYSWWDGFILYTLNQRLFNKKFHIMILEENSNKVSFFKYLGAFSVKKESRDMVASLNYAASLLNDPGNLVLIFPQGSIYSNFVEKVKFEKGSYKIMIKATAKFSLVYAACFTENFQNKKPSLNIHLILHKQVTGMQNLEESYQDFYQHARAKQTAKII